MDQSNQPQPAAHRDTMFCHECHDEWYRDEHGLTCPECGSDFTEIIEEDNDPRGNELFGHIDDGDDNESMPSLEEAPVGNQPPRHHNPFQPTNDTEGGDRLQWRQLGPGRFAVTGTVYRTFPPSRQGGGGGGDGGPNIMAGFQSMLNNIIGGGAGGNQAGQSQDQDGQGARAGSGTTPSGHEFRYTSSARLYPRDADNPGPRMEPVDELHNVLVGLMAAFDQGAGRPGGPHAHGPGGHGHDMPINPLLALLAGMMPGNGAAGDFVYSQEAMDRIVSQLMEQTQTSNAPGPASQQEIDALPRKKVTVDMLGPEGRAECSICMDEVNIGEEVTELPCHHWFHHPCISAWLGEHDTCPHCRKGISKEGSANSNANANAGASTNPNASSSASPGHQMPGSFVTGERTPEHPFIVQEANQGEQGSSEEQSSSGGLGDRLRRSLFGPPSR